MIFVVDGNFSVVFVKGSSALFPDSSLQAVIAVSMVSMRMQEMSFLTENKFFKFLIDFFM